MRVKTWQFTLDDAIWTVALDLVRSLTVRLLRNGEQTDVLRFPFTAKRLEFAVGEKSAFIAGEREGRRRTLHLHIDGQHMPSKATVRIGAADLFWRPIGLLEVADRVLLFGGMSAAAVCLVQTLALTHWAGAGALAQGAVWLALFFGILVRNSRLAACLGLMLPLLEFAIIFAAPDMVDGAALAGVTLVPLAIVYPLNRAVWARRRLAPRQTTRWRSRLWSVAGAAPAIAVIGLIAVGPGLAVATYNLCGCAGRPVGLVEAARFVREGQVDEIQVRGRHVSLTIAEGQRVAFSRADRETAAEMLLRSDVARADLMRVPYYVLPFLTLDDLFDPHRARPGIGSLTGIARATKAGRVHDLRIDDNGIVGVFDTGQPTHSGVESGITATQMLHVLGVTSAELERAGHDRAVAREL